MKRWLESMVVRNYLTDISNCLAVLVSSWKPSHHAGLRHAYTYKQRQKKKKEKRTLLLLTKNFKQGFSSFFSLKTLNKEKNCKYSKNPIYIERRELLKFKNENFEILNYPSNLSDHQKSWLEIPTNFFND